MGACQTHAPAEGSGPNHRCVTFHHTPTPWEVGRCSGLTLELSCSPESLPSWRRFSNARATLDGSATSGWPSTGANPKRFHEVQAERLSRRDFGPFIGHRASPLAFVWLAAIMGCR